MRGTCDYLLCLVPDIRVSQELLWSGGQVEFEGKAKNIVHSAQEVQATLDLLFNLRSNRKELLLGLKAKNAHSCDNNKVKPIFK